MLRIDRPARRRGSNGFAAPAGFPSVTARRPPAYPRITCRAVSRAALICACAVAVIAVAGCGEAKIEVPKKDAILHHGAVLFNQRCSGCHTLSAADARGSRPVGQVGKSERTDGPNFDIRKENRDDVLFAIRNGGFSGAIMPANVVVGKDAQAVALFVEHYAGQKAPPTSGVKSGSPTGSSGNK